jgi:putative endonuclease
MPLPSTGSFHVYILLCADGSYYVGLTRKELAARVHEHDTGRHRGYTFSRRPMKLVRSHQFQRLTDAIACERQLKGWRRAKKEAFIRGEFSLLPGLAKTAWSGEAPHPSTSSG